MITSTLNSPFKSFDLAKLDLTHCKPQTAKSAFRVERRNYTEYYHALYIIFVDHFTQTVSRFSKAILNFRLRVDIRTTKMY